MTPLRGLLVPFLAGLVLIAVGLQDRARGQSLRDWFNSLRSPAGSVCCVDFDGRSLEEADWRIGPNGYQVLAAGKWIDVPADAVVAGPNRLGRAHLWLRPDGGVRCFIPGSAG